jgi:hypothetical protein
MSTSLFLKSSDVKLEFDPDVRPVVVNCTAYVRDKMNENIAHIYHPVFGKRSDGKWPDTTNLACLHCCEGFDNMPIPLPRHYDERKNLYYVYGVFCSVNCAKAYVIEHETGITTKRMMYLNHMLRFVFKVTTPAKPAPPRLRLARFGGDLTIDQFRNNFHHVLSRPLQPPFVPSVLLFEEIPDPRRETMVSESPQSEPSITSENSSLQNPLMISMYSQFLKSKTESTDDHLTAPTRDPETKERKRRPKKTKKTGVKRAHGTLNAFLTFKE